jgi:hypothetical protein
MARTFHRVHVRHHDAACAHVEDLADQPAVLAPGPHQRGEPGGLAGGDQELEPREVDGRVLHVQHHEVEACERAGVERRRYGVFDDEGPEREAGRSLAAQLRAPREIRGDARSAVALDELRIAPAPGIGLVLRRHESPLQPWTAGARSWPSWRPADTNMSALTPSNEQPSSSVFAAGVSAAGGKGWVAREISRQLIEIIGNYTTRCAGAASPGESDVVQTCTRHRSRVLRLALPPKKAIPVASGR